MNLSVQCWVSSVAVLAAVLVAGPVFAQLKTGTGNRLSTTGPVRVGAATAQSRTVATTADKGDKKDDKVEIKRFPKPNKTSMVRTPEYNTSAVGGQAKISKRPREWALFEIHYATAAKWMDELSFTYYVMTKGKDEEGKEAYSFYTLTLRYVNIPKGDHMSSVALPPSMVERYGEPISLALEIVGKDGTVLASQSESIIPFPTKEWWKDPNVLDRPQVSRRTGGLLDRSKTPFALINADDYEVVL
ncbi:MAG: hypothetical protein WCJ02_13885 [bacterium]